MKTSLDLDPVLWRKFRIACIERDVRAKVILEALIRKQLENWERSK